MPVEYINYSLQTRRIDIDPFRCSVCAYCRKNEPVTTDSHTLSEDKTRSKNWISNHKYVDRTVTEITNIPICQSCVDRKRLFGNARDYLGISALVLAITFLFLFFIRVDTALYRFLALSSVALLVVLLIVFFLIGGYYWIQYGTLSSKRLLRDYNSGIIKNKVPEGGMQKPTSRPQKPQTPQPTKPQNQSPSSHTKKNVSNETALLFCNDCIEFVATKYNLRVYNSGLGIIQRTLQDRRGQDIDIIVNANDNGGNYTLVLTNKKINSLSNTIFKDLQALLLKLDTLHSPRIAKRNLSPDVNHKIQYLLARAADENAKKNNASAEKAYSQIFDLDPENTDAMVGLAVCALWGRENPMEALEWFNLAAEYQTQNTLCYQVLEAAFKFTGLQTPTAIQLKAFGDGTEWSDSGLLNLHRIFRKTDIQDLTNFLFKMNINHNIEPVPTAI